MRSAVFYLAYLNLILMSLLRTYSVCVCVCIWQQNSTASVWHWVLARLFDWIPYIRSE